MTAASYALPVREIAAFIDDSNRGVTAGQVARIIANCRRVDYGHEISMIPTVIDDIKVKTRDFK